MSKKSYKYDFKLGFIDLTTGSISDNFCVLSVRHNNGCLNTVGFKNVYESEVILGQDSPGG